MRLKDKLVHMMAENNVIKQDEIDIYRFGVQILSETIISFAIFLIIAALFESVVEVTIFTVAFALLRQYAGGFHADKFISCLLISCGIVTAFCMIIHLPNWIAYLIGALATISLIVIFCLSPADSKYKPISNSDKKKYKRKLVITLFIEIITTAVIVLYSVHFALCILSSWIVLSGLLIIGKSKK